MSQTPGSAAVAPPCLPKPILKGLHHAKSIRNLLIAIALSGIISTIFKLTHNNGRKKKYINFYKNYDAQKSFERMRDAGLLQSCAPEKK